MFDAREHVHELDDFPFTGLDGQEHKLPNIGTLTGHQIARLDVDDMALIKELDKGAYEALMDMPVAIQRKLALAWMEHGDDAGKGGPPRSKTTSTRSKRTPSKRVSTPAS